MTIGASKIQFLPLWKILPRVCSAALKEPVVIPPRTEVMVAAKLEPVKNYEIIPDGYEGVLEANAIFSE